MSPRVSILIPCFRSAAFVGDAIRSALAQTWKDAEILVADDGSRDGTLDVLRAFGPTIRWETGPHRGRNPTRNRLLARARGEWLQYLDADDVLAPTKIERQMQIALRSGADLVVAPCLDEDGSVLHAPCSDDPWEGLLATRLGVTSSNLFRREAVERAGGWDPRRLAGQEYALMQAMLRGGARVAFDAEPLVTKRRRGRESLWRSDRRMAHHESLTNLRGAIGHLEETGALTPARRQVAGRRFFVIARWFRNQGDPFYLELLARARAVDPDGSWTLPALPRGCHVAHRVLGRRLGGRVARRLLGARR